MTSKRLLAIGLAGLLLTSGCLGFGVDAGSSSGGDGASGSDGANDGDEDSGSDGDADAGGNDADAGSDADAGVALGADERVDDFEDVRTEAQMADLIDRSPYPVIRPGERYRFEGTSALYTDGESQQALAVEIDSAAGGEWPEANATVRLTRGASESTATEAEGALMFTPELSLLSTGRTWVWLYRFNVLQDLDFEPRVSELSVGDTWTYETPGDEDDAGFDFAVTERRTYAGQECVVVEVTAFGGAADERRLYQRSCLADDVGLPLYYAQYDDEGTAMVELELVEYER